MKKQMRKLTETERKLYPLAGIIEGWRFHVNEISAGYYRVSGIDGSGRSVSRDGTDPETLLLLCKKDIINILSEE